MKKYSILIALVIFSSLQANLEEYFKPVTFKEPQNAHPIQHVDFAYVINLDQRPEKYKHTLKELVPFNIIPCRFSAVNGWELSLEAINQFGLICEPGMKKGIMGTTFVSEDKRDHYHELIEEFGKTYFVHCMAQGTMGIVLSHLSVLQDAYDSGYQTIWVMEDDIEVIRDPHILSELIIELDNAVGEDNWDILFTDRDTKDWYGKYVPCAGYAPRPNYTPSNPERFQLNQQVSENIRRIGARYGAYSMIVRRSGMKKILDFINTHKIFLPFDMDFTQPNDIKLYTVLEDVVSTQSRAISDNGAPNYKNKISAIVQD